MIRASLYIVGCTAKNRIRRWVARLREPRYLIGALAAGAYFYFAVFARLGRRRRGGVPPDFLASLQPAGGALVGLWILVMAAGAWIFPFDSGLLDFSPAETELLFPAPVSRRQLIVHRLLRSQIGLALAGILPAIFIPFGSNFARVRFALAIWLMVVTGKLYTTGVTLARTRGLRRSWAPLALVFGIVAVVAASVWQALAGQPYTGVGDLIDQIGRTVTAAPARVALLPLTALGAPLFARTGVDFAGALAGAVAVMIATLVWVLRADEVLQDAAADAVARRERADARLGRARAARGAWTLAPTGRPEMVFAWKAAVQTFRVVDRRAMIRLVIIVASVVAMAVALSQTRGIAAVVGLIGLGGSAYVVLMAPQILRIDLRQDLQQLEWLKTWPVRPAELVRGELIWPGVLLTALAWGLLAVGFAASSAVFGAAPLVLRGSAALGAAVLVPALVYAQLAIHNALALLFPGWVSLGRQRARGFDAIGQRLITIGATWLALIVALLPAILAGGIVWFAFTRLIGAPAIALGALAATAVVTIEVALASEALGPLFEKLDLTSVEKGG